MAQKRKFSIDEVREALQKHTGEKIDDLEIEDEQGNKVRGGISLRKLESDAIEGARDAARGISRFYGRRTGHE